MLKNIELIIYDLDGVLIDSSEAICETFNRVLHEVGEKSYPHEKIRKMIGEPLEKMYLKILPPSKHFMVNLCLEKYVEIFRVVAPRSTSLLPGVEEILSHFKALALKQCLATTKRSDVAGYILEHLGVKQYFDLILGVNDVKNPKPSPEIILLALQSLQVKKEDAVFIEDTTFGLEAGKRAEVHTVAVTTGTHSRQKLAKVNPEYLINDIRELKDFIIMCV